MKALKIGVCALLALSALCGCTSARQKWEDFKHYFLTDVMRW